MDHTDDFSQNWQVQGEGNQPLNEKTIEDFIQVHGKEQAIGYMLAVRDLIHELEFGIYDNRPNIGRGTRPLTRIKNNLEKLLAHKTNFLESVNEKQLLNSDYKPD
jgi:hypothetical protein